MNETINVIGLDCDVTKESFRMGNQICLVLKASNTALNKSQGAFPGEAIAKPSVFIEGVEVGENQTIIKDYFENSGILQKLVKAKIVKETGIRINVGFGENDFAYLVDVLI